MNSPSVVSEPKPEDVIWSLVVAVAIFSALSFLPTALSGEDMTRLTAGLLTWRLLAFVMERMPVYGWFAPVGLISGRVLTAAYGVLLVVAILMRIS